MTHDRQLVQTGLSIEQDDTGYLARISAPHEDYSLSISQMSMNNITDLEVSRSPLPGFFILHDVQRQPYRMAILVLGFQ
jgi:hypothetical protein